MGGDPIAKAKQTMALAIDGLRPDDTFNLITIAGDTHVLWDAPRPADAANLAEAQAFLESRQGKGGTEMMKAINAALVQTAPAEAPRDLTLAELAAGRPIALITGSLTCPMTASAMPLTSFPAMFLLAQLPVWPGGCPISGTSPIYL